ncbi:MAG TPA: hypothetical protein VLQ20_07390 [Planococcus sp. (in: firmicutes)]|nr:hypothetical protein [Planococcus sp. (in: firmicutes)]
MGIQRITVGYVELTEPESEQLFKKVKKDKGINSYDGLQSLMEDFDSRVIEPAAVVADDGTGKSGKGTRFIEVFNTVEDDTVYRIKSSDQS